MNHSRKVGCVVVMEQLGESYMYIDSFLNELSTEYKQGADKL